MSAPLVKLDKMGHICVFSAIFLKEKDGENAQFWKNIVKDFAKTVGLDN